jgi:phosphoglycolate phosphatase
MSPGQLRVVVFDLDGTLIDSLDDIADAANATLTRLGAPDQALSRDLVRDFVGEGVQLLMSRCLAAARLDRPLEPAVALFREIYRAHLLDQTSLYPGVLETLDLLRDRRLAVLSNKLGDMSRAILEGLGVADRFFRILGGDDVAKRKPHPAGLLAILEELHCPPHESVMVGDSNVDIRAGRAAGARTAGVTYGFAPQSLRDERPDVIVESIRELPGALTRLSC